MSYFLYEQKNYRKKYDVCMNGIHVVVNRELFDIAIQYYSLWEHQHFPCFKSMKVIFWGL